MSDRCVTHEHPAVQQWRTRQYRFVMRFTPTSASWLRMVERLFRDLTTVRPTQYGRLRRHLGEVFRKLAQQKENTIVEGRVMPDHVDAWISIPPKYAAS
jgi:hypothetical protein